MRPFATATRIQTCLASEYLAQALNLLPVCQCRLSSPAPRGVDEVWRGGGPRTDGMHGTADRVSQARSRSQSRTPSSGPRRRCRRRIKCKVRDHRCRARWMEPPWASSAQARQALCSNWPASAVSGSGAQGTAPHPDRNAKLQAHGPRSSRQLGGPRHKLAWSRDGGNPKSLAHLFYPCAAARLPTVLPCTMHRHSSFTPLAHQSRGT